MNVVEGDLPGVLIVTPRRFVDERGFLQESFQAERYRAAGINHDFVQDVRSRSTRGVLRGLHAQKRHPQGKLVEVVRGEIFDVVLDIDPMSPQFGKWFAARLSEENGAQMWIPPGYAHGFLVLSEVADVVYKCTDYYHPEDEIGVIWNDPVAAIDWPMTAPIVSAKDRALPTLATRRHS